MPIPDFSTRVSPAVPAGSLPILHARPNARTSSSAPTGACAGARPCRPQSSTPRGSRRSRRGSPDAVAPRPGLRSGRPPYTSERSSDDLLHTSDYGRTWRDVLQIKNSTDLPPLPVPLSPSASAPKLQPAAGIVIPGPLVLPSSSSVWQTVVIGNGSIAFAVSADDGQHWQWHRFPAPRHVPRSAPASRSVLPAGLPWLATTATDD